MHTSKLGPYELTFDAKSGAWQSLSRDGKTFLCGGNDLPEITLTTDGVTTVARGRDHLANIRNTIPVGAAYTLKNYQADEKQIQLVLEEQCWIITETFTWNEEKERIERCATIAYEGEGEKLLRYAHMNMPVVNQNNLQTLEMPGYNGVLHEDLQNRRLNVGNYPLALDGSDVDGVCWRPGVVAYEGAEYSLLTWVYGKDMPAIWRMENGKKGFWSESKWLCCCRMTKGMEISIGAQYIKVEAKPALEALQCIRPFWQEVGLYTKQPAEPWAKGAFIYEVQIGPKSTRKGAHNPYPTPQALCDDLDRIKDLGFTVIELMPHYPYPAYSVSDYFDIDVCYGDRNELRALIQAAHERGMHVFLDVVMHGVSDKAVFPNAPYDHHPLLDEHPEFFLQTEDGLVSRTYTWSFDQANPELRAYMKKVFCYYITELDADGFRVDALTWNYFPNWKKGLGYPAYKSIDGCYELFEAVRDAVWAIKPGVAFYSETTGPLMAHSFDMSYNYDEVWVYENLLPMEPWARVTGNWNKLPQGKEINAKEASQWLELRQKVLPENWIKVHHADSHDTYEWNNLGAFRRESMGLAQSRALFAYCCFVEGAVMNYVGGEWGSEDVYKALISARKNNPALLSGACDYTAVSADNDHLFMPLRYTAGQTMLPIINFSSDAANCPADLSKCGLDISKAWTLREHFSGQEITLAASESKELPLQIDPFGFQLWEICAD